MRIPRFFISHQDCKPNLCEASKKSLPFELSIHSPSVIKQITHVLRLRPNDKINLLNNAGQLWECTIVNLSNKSITCLANEELSEKASSSPSFAIGLPLIKGHRFDYCLEKLTEIGISNIFPMSTERTIIKSSSDNGFSANKMERWQNILKEASEQCERWTIPQIVSPIKFEECLKMLTDRQPFNVGFICTERLDVLALRSALNRLADQKNSEKIEAPNQVSILIGPEGGFTADEIELAVKFGFRPVSLGQRILRSETAAIYACALITSHFEN